MCIIFQTSCVTTAGYKAPFEKQALLGRDSTARVFVIKKDGTKIAGNVLTYSNRSNRIGPHKETWTAVDGQKVLDSDYEIIQTEKSYSHWFRAPGSTAWSMLFPDRLRYGKISLYYYSNEVDSYGAEGRDIRGDYHLFVFEKTLNKLEFLDYKSFDKALSDNPAAQQLFHQYYPHGKVPKHRDKGNLHDLIEVVELYNK